MINSAKMALLFLALIPLLYGCYGDIEGYATKKNPSNNECDLTGDHIRL